ncbi:MAG: peptide chain release factor-like protein [Candidatus Eisenbacteria bacterium]
MALSEELKKLLTQCDVETFRSSGSGGQHRNKTESCVRVRHRATGIARLGTEHRSQHRNRELALERLAAALTARARKPKPRVATRPTRAASTRRLDAKRRDSVVKRLRNDKPARDE